jgi:hypothetical protein
MARLKTELAAEQSPCLTRLTIPCRPFLTLLAVVGDETQVQAWKCLTER